MPAIRGRRLRRPCGPGSPVQPAPTSTWGSRRRVGVRRVGASCTCRRIEALRRQWQVTPQPDVADRLCHDLSAAPGDAPSPSR